MSTNINKANKTYALVEFINGGKKECAVVPLIWLVEELKICYWPKTKNEQAFEKLVFDNVPYDSTWKKCTTHRVLKTSDDYDGIMKYMEIILEHGSTEDDGMGISDIAVKRKMQQCDDREDSSDTSQSSVTDSEVYKSTKTVKHQEKSKNTKVNDGLSISDISVKKKLLEQYNDGKDSDTSQSSDSEVVRSKTAKNQKKHKNAKSMSKDSDSSKLLAVSKNKQKQNRFDREITENININIQSNKSLETVFIDRTENGNPISVSEGENNSTEILSTQQFQKYVIKRFEEVMVLLEQSNASFARLLNSVQTYMNPTSKPDGFPDLPLTTDDEFQKLEVMLSEKAKDDPNGQQIATLAYTYLKGRLSTIGGADQRSCVMNMLKFLMTNQLAMSYNWKGQHNKKSFEITKLREVIMEAAKIQFRGKESSDTAIKDAIQSWLKLAKNRHAVLDVLLVQNRFSFCNPCRQ